MSAGSKVVAQRRNSMPAMGRKLAKKNDMWFERLTRNRATTARHISAMKTWLVALISSHSSHGAHPHAAERMTLRQSRRRSQRADSLGSDAAPRLRSNAFNSTQAKVAVAQTIATSATALAIG